MALSSGLYPGKLGQNFNQSELSAAICTRHLVNKTAICLSWLSVFSVVVCYIRMKKKHTNDENWKKHYQLLTEKNIQQIMKNWFKSVSLLTPISISFVWMNEWLHGATKQFEGSYFFLKKKSINSLTPHLDLLAHLSQF